jgi:hypothetical protein
MIKRYKNQLRYTAYPERNTSTKFGKATWNSNETVHLSIYRKAIPFLQDNPLIKNERPQM